MFKKIFLLFIFFLLFIHVINGQEKEIEDLRKELQYQQEFYELKITELDSIISEISNRQEQQQQETRRDLDSLEGVLLPRG